MESLELLILLLTAVTFLSLIAYKYRFSFPIFLVISGLLISLIPGLPYLELKPEIVFFIFLPPLLYEAAWQQTWHDFKANLRPITLAGVGLVFFTTAFVALAAHYLIPGLGWAEAFVLGAVVSPPDAVAATSATKGLGLPKRITTIIEGESLVNDASGLVAFRYAVAAVATGNFIWWEAGMNFIWLSIMGIAIGLAIGYALYLVHKYVTYDPTIETTITFLTPYSAYLIAEHLHVSGVLAVVACGLLLSSKSSEIFSHQTRIKALSVWETVSYILNGLVFILIGLELKHVLSQISEYSTAELIWYGIAVSLVTIIVRFIWVFPAAYLPRWLSRSIREREKVFSWKFVFIFSWCGMRGVVSLAAALSIPLLISENTPFPNRDLIIFLTFIVIIITLVFQGLSLPYVIALLKTPKYSLVEEEFVVRQKLANHSIEFIEGNLAAGAVNETVLSQIKSKYEIKLNKLTHTDISGHNFGTRNQADALFYQFNKIQSELIKQERQALKELRKKGAHNDEIIRKIEHELDLEETRLGMDLESEA